MKRFDLVLVSNQEMKHEEIYLVLHNWSGSRQLERIHLLRLNRFDWQIGREAAEQLEREADERDLFYYYPDQRRLSRRRICQGPRCRRRRAQGPVVKLLAPTPSRCVEAERRNLGHKISRRLSKLSPQDRRAADQLLLESFQPADWPRSVNEAWTTAVHYLSIPVLRDLAAVLKS